MKLIALIKEKRWLEFPKAYLLCIVLAVGVALPGLGMGFFVDDYFGIGTLEGKRSFASPLDLFYFGPGDPDITRSYVAQGPFPWWTLPEFKAHFFRPLSSALIVLDHTLFGRTAVWYHVHSIVWYVLLVLAWGAILRRTLPGPVAVLALVIFALDDAHPQAIDPAVVMLPAHRVFRKVRRVHVFIVVYLFPVAQLACAFGVLWTIWTLWTLWTV